VELALALPSEWKLHGRQAKRALHEVFGPMLPRAVRARRKAGFDAPLSGWLRGALRPWVRDVLATPRLDSAGLVDGKTVQALLDAHDRGEADHAWRIWSLLSLCEWTRRHAVS